MKFHCESCRDRVFILDYRYKTGLTDCVSEGENKRNIKNKNKSGTESCLHGSESIHTYFTFTMYSRDVDLVGSRPCMFDLPVIHHNDFRTDLPKLLPSFYIDVGTCCVLLVHT